MGAGPPPEVKQQENFIISNFSFETRETLCDLALPIIVILGSMIGGAFAGSLVPGLGNAIGALAGAVTGAAFITIGGDFFIKDKLEKCFFTENETKTRNQKRENARFVNFYFEKLNEFKNLNPEQITQAKKTEFKALQRKINETLNILNSTEKDKLEDKLNEVKNKHPTLFPASDSTNTKES